MGAMTDSALLVVRLTLAAVFIVHGGQKLFKWMGGTGVQGLAESLGKRGALPALRYPLAWMAAFSEFGAGSLALLGLLTPLAGALVISVMLVAIMDVHFRNGFLNSNRGYEFNLSLIALALVLALLGGGSWSLDAALGLSAHLTGSLSQDFIWVPVLLVLVALGGVVLNVLARALNHPADDPSGPGVLRR